MVKKEIEEIKRELTAPRGPKKKLSIKDLLSTGSTLLNLSLSNRIKGGLYAGHYYWIAGDSDSGKTVVIMSIFAEASISLRFKDHRLIFDDPELGMLMDVRKLFGKKLYDRLEPPAGTKEDPRNSSTVEEVYDNIDDALKKKKPFIYILDSMDAVDTEEDIKKTAEQKTARRKGTSKEIKGTYGLSKAKKNSSGLRGMMAKLKKSDSIVIFISQAKTNLSPFSREKKTTSGGLSLKFFAAAQIWTSPAGKIDKKYKGRAYNQGTKVKVRIKKNRLTGSKATPFILPILTSVGIDDLGSCIDFLVEVKHWKKTEGAITTPEFGDLPREELVAKIEQENREEELRSVVGTVWKEIQEAISVKRKARY